MMPDGSELYAKISETSSEDPKTTPDPEFEEGLALLLFQVGISYMLLCQKDMYKTELVFVKVRLTRVLKNLKRRVLQTMFRRLTDLLRLWQISSRC